MNEYAENFISIGIIIYSAKATHVWLCVIIFDQIKITIVLIETPRMWAIPWDVVGLIFGVSIATLLLGMKMLLRRIRKENIMKIYRATT